MRMAQPSGVVCRGHWGCCTARAEDGGAVARDTSRHRRDRFSGWGRAVAQKRRGLVPPVGLKYWTMTRPGKQFENAVYQFVNRLGDSSATVLFDHKVIDRDTGTSRQVDAWVEAKMMGHYPFTALISCKDWKVPLDIDDIGCLCDQVRSTAANLGIIYARNGFTKNALLKAKQNSINCCKLYDDKPADTPDVLIFTSYCAKPQIWCGAQGTWSGTPEPKWSNLFELCIETAAGKIRVVRRLAELLFELQQRGQELATTGFPQPQEEVWRIAQDVLGMDLMLKVQCRWRCYRGRHEAHYINGSYCFTNGNFVGTQSGPTIDTQGVHPGPGWEEVDPAIEPVSASRVLVMLYCEVERYENHLIKGFWDKPLLPR